MRIMPLIGAVLGAALGATQSEKKDAALHAVLMGAVGYGVMSAVGDVTEAADKADKEREKEP
jgi:uncharacterized membrane protein